MHALLNIAWQAARAAGKVIVRSMERLQHAQITEKGRNDFVTDIDLAAENEIISIIRKAYPDHAVLGEETGASGTHDYQWIIDPIDGTTNYIHGFPHFCTSIAIKHKDTLQHGLIYDPLREELFTASRGRGATLNSRRLRVTTAQTLSGTLLGTGFPYKMHQQLATYLKILSALTEQAAGIRRAGSAALDLAYVAAGRLDGFWGVGLGPWDMAAGVLLVKEAGGLVTDMKGEERYMETGDLVAGNPKLMKMLLRTLSTCLRHS